MAKKTGWIILLLIILLLSIGNFGEANALGAIYYVSPTGSDSNPGTAAHPLRTIGKGIGKLSAGDTLYIRAGIYQESVWITKSGTGTNPIRIMAYPGETPVIDGNNYHLPTTTWDAMLRIDGNYVHVSGLEVRYSNWMCVSLAGDYSRVSYINVHHCRENGILVRGDYAIVENSRIWQSSNRNETSSGSYGWASGLSAARHPNYVTLRGNSVYNNWGEGISTYEANGTVIEDNIVYDNWSANVYISDATNVVLQRNLIYLTPNSVIKRGSRVGIMLGDEVYDPPSSNTIIVNNLVYGTHQNFSWWQGAQGGGMKNVLVANNTFVNSVEDAGIQIEGGPHQNVRLQNNIVLQEGSLPVAIIGSSSGLEFSHNLWSKTPPSNTSGQGDVIGDPQLSKFGQIAPGQLSGNWFGLLPTSPARDRAIQLGEVSVDYFQSPRGVNPDLGAIEYGAQIFPPEPGDTIGVFRPTNGLLYLKNVNKTGFADVAINYGLGGDYPVTGDWDGNGTVTIGVYRNGSFYLRNSNTLGFADLVFAFGSPGDQPVAGDWNGDGIDTIGVYRRSTGRFLLRNSNTSGIPEMSFYLGNVGDVGIAGDWDGDGFDTTGVFRPSNGIIFLKNTNTTGFADIALNYGLAGDQPLTGDWNDDGIDTIGIYRNGSFYLRNSNTIGFADIVFDLGIPGDMPIAGDWDGVP